MARNESQIRREIKTVLEHTKDIEHVNDRCGTSEYGVDLTFEQKDAFGGIQVYGVQIKVGDLTVNGNSSSGSVREVISQLAIAFGHKCPSSDQFLSAVYVVTSGEIKTHAQEYIRSARVGFREIHFVDGQALDKFLVEGIARTKKYQES